MNTLRHTMACLSASMALVLFSATICSAQDGENFENFRFEYTANLWLLTPSGDVNTSDTNVNFDRDLGIRDRKTHGQFQVVAKPGRKHRLLFEGVFYRLSGSEKLQRSFTIGGTDYPVATTVNTGMRLNYYFGGYQYDLFSRNQFHAGVLVGVGLFDVFASASSPDLGFASEHEKAPLPMVGGEFRVFPVSGKNVFNINGSFKGMSAGGYGRYIHGALNAGFSLSRKITVQAGYQVVDLDVHEKDLSDRFRMRFDGPVFSLQFRDR